MQNIVKGSRGGDLHYLMQNINLGKKKFSVFMLILKYLSTVHSRIDRLYR